MKFSGDLQRTPDGTWAGDLLIAPTEGELNAVYHAAEAALPPALRGFEGVYLASGGVRVKGKRGPLAFDVTVSLKASGDG